MDATERQTVIRGIKEKIAQTERAVQELPILKQTLAIFEADAAGDQITMQLPLRGPIPRGPISNGIATNGASPTTAEVPSLRRDYPIKVVKGSVGYHALQIIESAGKPTTVKEIMAELRARGKTNGEPTLVSVLCWYKNNKMIERTAASTYAVPNETANAQGSASYERNVSEHT